MTVLSRSNLDPSLMTIQCDLCRLPLIITNSETMIRALGWQLSSAGAEYDACPACRHAHDGRGPGELRRRGWQEPDGLGRLPDVLIIGAAKAGTTSLHAYLDAHPDVFMSPWKELRFFSDPDHLEWLRTYKGLLASSAAVVGESSTMYTRAPAIPGTAERIAKLVPNVRIIYLIRDPVERALASYVEERFHDLEAREPSDAFSNLDDPYNPYISASLYARQLAPFFERFPREQIRVVPLEDLRSAPIETVRSLYEFLRVDPNASVNVTRRLNERSTKVEYRGLAGKMRRSTAVHLFRRLPEPIRRGLAKPARGLLTTPIRPPDLSPELLLRIRALIAPDTAQLRELTGLELSSWSI